jgi:hypothetical protein
VYGPFAVILGEKNGGELRQDIFSYSSRFD